MEAGSEGLTACLALRAGRRPPAFPPQVSLGKTLTRYFQHFLNQVHLNRAAQINWRQKAQILSRPSPNPIFQPCLLCNYGLARCGGATTGANVQPPGFSLPGAPRGGRRPAARGAPCRETGWPRGRKARGGAGGRASPTPACKGRSGRRQRHRRLPEPRRYLHRQCHKQHTRGHRGASLLTLSLLSPPSPPPDTLLRHLLAVPGCSSPPPPLLARCSTASNDLFHFP